MYTLTLEKKKKSVRTLDIALLFIALFWISRGKFFFAFLLILIALVGFYINRKKIVVASESNIVYPYFIDKKIYWNEINNIILKDDILTIDLKNNKLLQATLSPANVNPDEKDFNAFCAKQLGIYKEPIFLPKTP